MSNLFEIAPDAEEEFSAKIEVDKAVIKCEHVYYCK